MFGINDAKKGMIVHRASGERLGPIISSESGSFIIDGGRKTEYVAEYSQIADIRDGEIWLKDRIGHGRGIESDRPTVAGREAQATQRIPLIEEELDVTKVQRQAGEVKIHKTVTEERRDVSVPVVREEVHVERVPASADAVSGQAEASFREETVSVPVMEEDIEVRKRPVVREEVKVWKERHVEQRAASETVRREDVDVDSDPESVLRRERGEREGGLFAGPDDAPGPKRRT